MLDYTAYPNTLIGEPGYPYGKAKNASSGTSLDGTPLLAPCFNDWMGWMQAILVESGTIPSGLSESSLASDVLNSIKIINGRYADSVLDDTVDIAYTTERDKKLKTIIAKTGCTEVAITKGADTDESNKIRIINESGGILFVTDGTLEFFLNDKDSSWYYFSAASLVADAFEYFEVSASGTVVVKPYTDSIIIDVTSTATVLTLDLTNAKKNVKIFVRNETASEITVKDAITTNTFYQEAGTAAEYGNAAGVLLKTSPEINYNTGVISGKDTDTILEQTFSANGDFFLVASRWFNLINIDTAGVTVTVKRDNITGTPIEKYVIMVRNASAGIVFVADAGTTVELKATSSVTLRLRATNNLDVVTPRVDNVGKLDPRDQMNGFIRGNLVTINTIFDTLAPFIPDIGDTMKINGAFYTSELYIIGYAHRYSSGGIAFYSMNSNGFISSYAIDDGSTTTIKISISW